jgi:hypothetical protein
MKNTITKTVDSIRIDIDNMIEDLRQERDAWRDRFNEVDKLRLKELYTISKKLSRLSNTLQKEKIKKGFVTKNDCKDGFIAGAKWQQERMYSKEDLKEICDKYHNQMCLYGNAKAQEWFEQFKKK